MKKLGVKNLGIKTQGRRTMTDVEFTKVKSLCFELENEDNRILIKYKVSAQMRFQFHLVRLDGTYNLPRKIKISIQTFLLL